MQTLWLDIGHAVRVMRQSRGITAIAVLSLALAIGVNASVFSLLNAVVLWPLPAPRPDQLVAVETIRPNGTEGPLAFPAFDLLVSRQSVFSSVIGYWGDGIFSVETNGTLVRSDLWAVTDSFYTELGVRPFDGRLLTDADVRLDSRAPEMVAVLGYGIFQREFGGDLSVIGNQIRVEGHPFTVIGIAPRGFTGIGVTSEPDVTIPLTAAPLLMPGTADRFTAPNSRWVSVFGRLKDDSSLSDARAQLTVLWNTIRDATVPPGVAGKDRDDFLATRLQVSSAASGKEWFLRSRFTTPLYVILGAGALILLIACVNLASLTLSRAAARAHEVSVRVAIGASRSRIARQMITEGLVISVLAAAGGLLLAGWSSRALATMMTRDYLVPVALDVSPDARVLAFTVLIAIAAGVLFSLVPAWRMTRQDPAATLHQHGRALAASGRAIGRHIRIGTVESRRDLGVVGIVADARLFDPRDPRAFAVYVPPLQDGDSAQWSDFMIRTAGTPPSDRELRRAVQSFGRESIQSYRPLQRVLDRAILQERVTAILGGFFGALALALAAIGLYGLMAFGVERRRKEIAIRVALGSARSDVIRMVVRDALSLVVAGLAIGVPLALLSSRLVARLLFGLTPTDPVTLVVTAALLLAIGAIGGYIPGRRASTVDPVDALRA